MLAAILGQDKAEGWLREVCIYVWGNLIYEQYAYRTTYNTDEPVSL